MRLRPPEGASEDTLFAAFRLVAGAGGVVGSTGEVDEDVDAT